MKSTDINNRCRMMCDKSITSAKFPTGRDEHQRPVYRGALRTCCASGLLVMGVLSCFLGSGSVAFGEEDIVTRLKAHQEHFRSLVERSTIRTNRGREVLPFLEQPIAAELSAADKRWILETLASAGHTPEDLREITGFILDAAVIELLVVALADSDDTVREAACDLIRRGVDPRALVQQAAANKDKLMRMRSGCASRLLAELPLTPDERGAVLKGFRLDPEVRARLGDAEAEAGLIQWFANATDFSNKANAANALGYAGTRRCGEALVRGLKAPQYLVKQERRSVRVDIIKALGKIHPTEPLLTEEIKQVERGDEYLGGPEGVQRYLEQVYAWARATYGFAPEGPEPGLFLIDRGRRVQTPTE